MIKPYDGTWEEGDGTVHEKDPEALSAYNEELSSMTDDQLVMYLQSLSGGNQNKQDETSSMTDDELIAHYDSLIKEQLPENRYTDLGEYYKDRVESGITATPSMVGAAVKTILIDPVEKISSKTPEELLKEYGLDVVENIFGFMTKTSMPSTDNKDGAFDELYHRFGENFMNYQHGYQELFHLDVDKTGKLPPNDFHRYLGAGVEAASDPYGLLVKTGGAITNVLARVSGLQIVGMGSEAGGDFGGALEKSLTGEPETGLYRTIGSMGAAIPSAMVSAPITSTLFDTGGSAIRKYKEIKGNAGDAQQAYATTYVKGVLAKIVEENPDIDSILGDLSKIGIKWDAGDFPLIAAAGQSPTAHSQLVKLAKTNAGYRHGFEMELKRMKDLVESNADRIFGNRYAQLPWSDAAIKKGMQARQQRLIKARGKVDDRIYDLQESLDPSMSDLDRGIAIKKLVDQRERLARAELKPIYDDLIDEAAAKGVHVPAEVEGDFYMFIKANAVRDLFGKLTDVDKQVLSKLKPKIKTDKGIEIPEFKSMSFAQVESLKSAINRLKRSPMSKKEMRKLQDFEKEFDIVRENLYTKGTEIRGVQTPGGSANSFNERLRGVDKLYYEKVGLPFDAEAIAQIGKKRYSTEVANIILKNREALDQYMNVAGAEGPQLARDAMIAKLHRKVVVDGIIDNKKLNKELIKNKDVIDGIPGMRDELDNLKMNSDYLSIRMGHLNDALKIEGKKISDHFLSTKDFSDYGTLVEGMISSSKKRNKFLAEVKMLDRPVRTAVMERVRREFVESLGKRPKGAYEFMTNSDNEVILNSIMGKGYTEDLKDFAKVIDAMQGIPVHKLSATMEATEVDYIGKYAKGLDAKYVSSQIRDRISSITMKMTRLTSKMLDYKTKQDMDRSVFELLVDRDGMKKVNAAVAKMDFNIDTPLKLKNITGVIKDVLPVYMYTGMKTAVSHEAEEIERKIQ